VQLARNGQEALDFLQAHPGAVDVVLMDVQMPLLDGHDATRRIRGELGLTSLPIFALTAGALSSERVRAEAAGMDEFIVKPFVVPALVNSILRHVRPLNAEIMARPRRPSAAAAEVAPKAKGEWPQIPGIDIDDVRDRLRGDLPLFLSMLRRLLDEFTGITTVSAAASPATLAEHARRMHKLKGGAGTLGARAIHGIATEAEAACLAGDADTASLTCDRLALQLRRLGRAVACHVAKEVEPLPAAREPLGSGALSELIDLLHQQSITAIERFHALAPQLLAELGADAFGGVRGHIENLRFSEAADVLGGVGVSRGRSS
jgi:CheY-like chemotaxis protein